MDSALILITVVEFPRLTPIIVSPLPSTTLYTSHNVDYS